MLIHATPHLAAVKSNLRAARKVDQYVNYISSDSEHLFGKW